MSLFSLLKKAKMKKGKETKIVVDKNGSLILRDKYNEIHTINKGTNSRETDPDKFILL